MRRAFERGVAGLRCAGMGALVCVAAACDGSSGSIGSGGSPPPRDAREFFGFGLALEPAADGLSTPVFLTAPAGDPRLFIVEREGRIRVVQNSTLLATPFLDISSRVSTSGERGLFSMAFAPDYATSGFFFVCFTDLNGDVTIERYRVSSADPGVADPTPLLVLSIAHRDFDNHNGGLVKFGPDRLLYIGTGDGGGGGDPSGNAQNPASLLGKLLRIDVGAGTPGPPEIWARGLRNPWRYAFDAQEGLLYVADVGQTRIEEVSVVPVTAGGVNYGWNIIEGSLCFAFGPCDKEGLVLPVVEYGHDAGGGCSITGGFVYRGGALPELQGRYFYSDFCSGWLRSFHYSGGAAMEHVDWNIAGVGQIFSFGEDAQRELYMLSADRAWKIVRAP